MKAIGFNQGQFGDLCINLAACKSFRQQFPNHQLYFGINKKYAELKDIFLNNDLIDKIHIWDQYDSWPSQQDLNFISNEKFNIIFDPMPLHTQDHWYLNRHQTEEVCLMHGLTPPKDLSLSLNRYFNVENNKNLVPINLFAETRGQDKMPSPSKAKQIINFIESFGYTPVQIGLANQPQLCENRFIGTFFETVQFVLSCKLLITVDSAMSWIASAYSFPTIGLYSYSYYPLAESSKNWQPINHNANYLESNLVENIENDKIISIIKEML